MAVPTLAELSTKHYKDQAIWFLNGFWTEGAKEEAEHVWDAVQKFIELDERSEEGNELNEFDSHRILEMYDETLSAIKMREALREIDQDNNKHMSLLEYLIWRYKKTVDECVNSPQGDNQEEIDECQKQLDEVQTALDDVLSKLAAQKEAAAANAAAVDAQKQAVAENAAAVEAQKQAVAANEAAAAANAEKVRQQEAAVAAADAALAQAKVAEDEVRAAEAELQAALDELKAQEDAYNGKIAELEAKSQDTSVGVVTRNKAANELAQLKGEDPLPLRKAKITQEAALRRVGKAREAAEAATAEADAKKQELEAVQRELEATQAALEEAQRELEAKQAELEETQRQLEAKQAELEETQRQLEAAVAELESAFAELEQKMAEAEQALAEAKAKPGVAHGFFWWSGRTMYRADESLPRAKQKYDHGKPFEYHEE